EKSTGGVKRSADESGFFADGRGGDGSGRYDECVNLRIFQRKMKRSDEFLAHLQGFQVRNRGNLHAHLEARAHVFTIVRRAFRKPTGLLMIEGGFGPG